MSVNNENMPPAEQERPSLDDARSQYVGRLAEFRHQFYLGLNNDDHARLEQSSNTYRQSFQAHLLGLQACNADNRNLGATTLEEIQTRRSNIAEAFTKSPVQMVYGTEAFLGMSTSMSAVLNAVQGHWAAAVGSGILSATIAAGLKYRKNTVIDSEIKDNDLVKSSLEELEQKGEETTVEHSMNVLGATVESEKLAVMSIAAVSQRAKTFTPFGYARLAIYKARTNWAARSKKA